jgi:D-aminoacyl-tRNA deacylase
MRAVIQRVSRAKVSVDNTVKGEINEGLLVYLGVGKTDEEDDIDWLARKIVNLRIFEDSAGAMNVSVKDKNGEILLISQFTLFGNTKKGTRPSFNDAAPPNIAEPIYERFIKRVEVELGKAVPTGKFAAMMEVDYVNNGPVTIIIDSKMRDF